MKRLALLFTLLALNQAFAAVHPTLQSEPSSFSLARQKMVEEMKGLGIRNPVVLEVMGRVQRHEFVPQRFLKRAYKNMPIPVGDLQVISHPHMVALMTEATRPRPGQKVLEIGTASGYQAAVLAEIVDQVYTIEIVPELARSAAAKLKSLGYSNVHVKDGDGFFGWPEAAPFDSIIITCTADRVPPMLAEQLKEGGRIIMPLGEEYSTQTLVVITKVNGRLVSRPLVEVQFVPMVGEIKK